MEFSNDGKFRGLDGREFRERSNVASGRGMPAPPGTSMPVGNPNAEIWQAAFQGDLETVVQRINDGVDVNTRDAKFGRTALWIACCEGHIEVVRYLKSVQADETIRCDGNTTAQEIAKKRGHTHINYFFRTQNEYFPSMTQSVATAQRRVSYS